MGSVTAVAPGEAASPAIPSKNLPYWQVNVPESEREVDCPPYLQNIVAKDKGIISTPNEDFEINSWEQVRETVARNRLHLLERVPSELRRYLKFIYYLKQEHGTVMNYLLKHRLHWEEPVVPKGKTPFEEPEDVKVLVNDWPYALDARIVHLVVWTKFELPDDQEADDLSDEAREMVNSYVRETFHTRVPQDRVIWFKNWKSLKSIRAVEHFHVLIFNPDPDFIREITNGDTPMCDSFV